MLFRSLKSNLKEFPDLARISRTLVTLNQQLDLNADWDAMRVGRVDVAKLTALFHEFGFRRFIDEAKSLPSELKLPEADDPAVASQTDRPSAEPPRRCQIIDNSQQLAVFLEQLRVQREFCLDVVSSSPNPSQADIVAITFTWGAGQKIGRAHV